VFAFAFQNFWVAPCGMLLLCVVYLGSLYFEYFGLMR